jgi:hypothetical protein
MSASVWTSGPGVTSAPRESLKGEVDPIVRASLIPWRRVTTSIAR